MPFNSESAREAGKKSRRGKSLVSSLLKEQFETLTDRIITEIQLENLSNSERIAMLRLMLPYLLPKIQTEKTTEETETKEFKVQVINGADELRELRRLEEKMDKSCNETKV
jgi:DNA-binding transcriptional regulator WhiA